MPGGSVPRESSPFIGPGAGEALARAQHELKQLEKLPAVEISHSRSDPPDVISFESAALVPGWLVAGKVAKVGETLGVRELSITPVDDSCFVTSSRLRELSLEGVVESVHKHVQVAELINQARQRFNFPEVLSLGDAARATTGSFINQRGRQRLSDDYLERLSEAYLAEAPNGSRVYERVANRLGMDLSTPDTARTIRNHLYLARKREWLTGPPKTGAPGGGPGPELKKARSRRGAQDGPTEDLQGGEGETRP